jgi:uncharacterized protein YqkB
VSVIEEENKKAYSLEVSARVCACTYLAISKFEIIAARKGSRNVLDDNHGDIPCFILINMQEMKCIIYN